MFTDTHAHLLREYYDNIDTIIKEANENSINRVINCSYDERSILEVVALSRKYSNLYGVIGIHPSEASRLEQLDFSIIIDNLESKNIIAIGEIGLDYHYGTEEKEKQKILFRKQLEIAEKYNMPVVIHSRDATEDTINILKEYKVKGVIHSFSGSLETAKIYIKMGYYLGINGVVTFKNSKLMSVLKELGINNIILETDSPYLTPEPFRGKINYPKYIYNIAEAISGNLDIELDELSHVINRNISRIFDI